MDIKNLKLPIYKTKVSIFKNSENNKMDRREKIENDFIFTMAKNMAYEYKELSKKDLARLFSSKYYKINSKDDFIYFDQSNNRWIQGCKNTFVSYIYEILEKMFNQNKIWKITKSEEEEKKNIEKIYKKAFNQLYKGKYLRDCLAFLSITKPEELPRFNKKYCSISFNDGFKFDFKTKECEIIEEKDYFTKYLNFSSKILLDDSKDEEIKKIISDWLTPHGQELDYEICENLTNHLYASLAGRSSRYLTVFTGPTLNGKSCLIKLINKAFGDFAGSLSEKIFIDRGFSNNITSERVALDKYRIGYFNEGTGKLNEQFIKTITGRDAIIVRDLGKTEYEIKPDISLFMTCNQPPSTSGDQSIEKRIRAYYFPNTYKRDKEFEDYLESIGKNFLGYILRKGKLTDEERMTSKMIEAKNVINEGSDYINRFLQSSKFYEKIENYDYNKRKKGDKDAVSSKNLTRDIENYMTKSLKKSPDECKISQIKQELIRRGFREIRTKEGLKFFGIKKPDPESENGNDFLTDV